MSRKPQTEALLDRVRQLYSDAEAREVRISLADIAREIGKSRAYAGQLLEMAGLAPMPMPPPKPRGPKLSRSEVARLGGLAQSAAKSEAARANIVKARAAKPGSAAGMRDLELVLRASKAKSPVGAARWLRILKRRGSTLTPRQQAILDAQGETEKRARKVPAKTA